MVETERERGKWSDESAASEIQAVTVLPRDESTLGFGEELRGG